MGDRNNIQKRIAAIFLSSISVGLCLFFLQATKSSSGALGATQQTKNLEMEIQESENALGFVVWDAERKRLLRKLLNSYQQKINGAPYRALQWQKTLDLQEILNVDDKQQLWVFDKSLQLNKWNHAQHQNLGYFCVRLREKMPEKLLERCRKVFMSMSNRKTPQQLAKLYGVELNLLERHFLDYSDSKTAK